MRLVARIAPVGGPSSTHHAARPHQLVRVGIHTRAPMMAMARTAGPVHHLVRQRHDGAAAAPDLARAHLSPPDQVWSLTACPQYAGAHGAFHGGAVELGLAWKNRCARTVLVAASRGCSPLGSFVHPCRGEKWYRGRSSSPSAAVPPRSRRPTRRRKRRRRASRRLPRPHPDTLRVKVVKLGAPCFLQRHARAGDTEPRRPAFPSPRPPASRRGRQGWCEGKTACGWATNLISED